MTRREAKQYACRCVTQLLRDVLNSGHEWFFCSDEKDVVRGEKDLEHLHNAIRELIMEFERRGK